MICGYILLFYSLAQLTSPVLAQGSMDLPAGTCVDYLSQAYTWQRCEGTYGNSLTKCSCALPEFIESTIYCIDLITGDDRNRAYSCLQSICTEEHFTLEEIQEYSRQSQQLQPFNGTESGMGPVATTAFAVSREELQNPLKAFEAYNTALKRAHNYGYGYISYWFGVVLLRSVWYISAVLFPQVNLLVDSKLSRALRSHLMVPATFGYHHTSMPVVFRKFHLNIPVRLVSLILVGAFVLNIFLDFAGIPMWRGPNYLYSNDNGRQFARHLAIRTSFMALFKLPLLFLFAGRNNFMLYMTGWPLDIFNVFHKWLARATFCDLIIHAVCYSVVRSKAGSYSEMWSVTYWQWGVAAIFMVATLCILAVYWLRRLNYELFLVVHIALAIMFVVTSYHHLAAQGMQLAFHYTIIAVWGFDRLVRLGRILISHPFAQAHVCNHGDSIIEITIKHSERWAVYPGSYVFVHFLQPSMFWESHPFSMMEAVEKGTDTHIKLYCRVKKGMTRRLLKKCNDHGGSFETRVWLDGPYGHIINLDKFHEVVLIAGGIGVTSPFSHIQELVRKGHNSISLYWSIANEEPLKWFSQELEYMALHGVNVQLYIGGRRDSEASCDSEKQSSKVLDQQQGHTNSLQRHFVRMDAYDIVRDRMIACDGPLAVVVCGPGGINDSSRQAVADTLSKAGPYVEYFEESFSW